VNSTVAKRALGVHSADVPARSRMSSSHQDLSGLSQHRNLENSIIEPTDNHRIPKRRRWWWG